MLVRERVVLVALVSLLSLFSVVSARPADRHSLRQLRFDDDDTGGISEATILAIAVSVAFLIICIIACYRAGCMRLHYDEDDEEGPKELEMAIPEFIPAGPAVVQIDNVGDTVVGVPMDTGNATEEEEEEEEDQRSPAAAEAGAVRAADLRS